MSLTTIFFDLDDTLYPNENGLWEAIRERMNQYMVQKLDLPRDEVLKIRAQYYRDYGTTLRGLQYHHQIDADEYLNFVHDLPLQQFLKPDPELRRLIGSMPQQRWIFTNADIDHAQRVLDTLNLSDCFLGIIDVRAIEFACKPEVIAYQRALAIAGNPDPTACMLLDDSASNLHPAHQMGFTTVLVGSNGEKPPGVDYSIKEIFQLPQVYPQLWSE